MASIWRDLQKNDEYESLGFRTKSEQILKLSGRQFIGLNAVAAFQDLLVLWGNQYLISVFEVGRSWGFGISYYILGPTASKAFRGPSLDPGSRYNPRQLVWTRWSRWQPVAPCFLSLIIFPALGRAKLSSQPLRLFSIALTFKCSPFVALALVLSAWLIGVTK